jgi:starvation-inducible outer membrane lipoprotein
MEEVNQMKLKLFALLGALSFLSACSSLPEAQQSNIKVGQSKVYWINPATGQPGGYIVSRTAAQKNKNDQYADSNESRVISR